MRILHVTRQFPPGIGGLEEVVAQLAEAQARVGHDVRVVTLDRIFAKPDEKLVARENWMGAEIVRIPYTGSSRYPLAPTVLAHLGDADIVHVHAIDFFFDFLALARAFKRRRLVATTHGGFFHTQAQAGLKKLWFSTITRASARAYDAIVACSAADFAMFEPIARDNLELIENGVDLDKFADRASRRPTKRLVTIGRFSVNKRLDRLLDAMAVLARQDAEWSLDIVGGASDWSGNDLAREIAARGLQGVVRAHVGATNAAAAEVVAGASIFVSASEHEGFGLSLIEALSAGLVPVVEGNAAFRAFAAHAPQIAIADFSSPARAAAEIVAAHARLLADPEGLRAHLIAAAAPYAWKGVAARYMQLYERLAAR